MSSFPFAGGIAYQFGTLMPIRGEESIPLLGVGSGLWQAYQLSGCFRGKVEVKNTENQYSEGPQSATAGLDQPPTNSLFQIIRK